MKKTLLATAIAGALGASAAAQAATVYDQDGTRLDIYGRIAMGIAGGGPEYDSQDRYQDNSVEFVDVFSRLGLRGQQQISSDLTGFAHLEWRFRADEAGSNGSRDFEAFTETRQSYFGLRSDSFGTVQAGNFDSFYNMFVSSPFDVYIDRGLEFATHRTQSRGDSIGYYTPDLGGFQAFLQAKHYSERGRVGVREASDSEIVTQGGVKYEVAGLRLALGYVDDKAIENTDDPAGRLTGANAVGNDEVRYGATASYAFNDNFSARLGFETRDNNEDYGGGFDKYGLGLTYAMGQWAFNADLYQVDHDDQENRTAWAAGTYYKLSNNFDVFAELHQADQADIDITLGSDPDISTADGDDVYYLVGARYHF